jgi:hypothetical protein
MSRAHHRHRRPQPLSAAPLFRDTWTGHDGAERERGFTNPVGAERWAERLVDRVDPPSSLVIARVRPGPPAVLLELREST